MRIPRGTMFFSHSGFGWTENYWFSGTAANISYDQMLTGLRNLAVMRQRLLGVGPVISYLRVSDDAYRRDTEVALADYNNALVPTINRLSGNADAPWMALMLRAESGPLYHTQRFLSGIPDDLTDFGQPSVNGLGTTTNTGFTKNLEGFLAKLIAGQWGWKTYVRPPEQASTDISAISNVALLWTVTSNLHGFAVGDVVVIEGTRPSRGITGTYTVNAVTANTFSFVGKSSSPSYISGGIAFKKVPTIKPFLNLVPIRTTHRIRGRDFFRPRGRSRSRT